MATTHVVNGHEVKERNPFGVWALCFLTLGIYYLVWYYKINKELRRAHDIDVDPAMSVLAITFGGLLIVPPFVSTYKTGRRVERAQYKAGITDRISPVLSFILSFLFALHVIYLQSNMNKLWEQAAPLPQSDASPLPPASPAPQERSPQPVEQPAEARELPGT